MVSRKVCNMGSILDRLLDNLCLEATRGTFRGLSDETVLRVLFAYAAGYLNGFNVSFSEAYAVIMKFYDDTIRGVLGVNK